MTYFLKSGASYNVSTKEAMDLHDKLPAGNYVVKEAPMGGPLYLEQIESFEIKGKIYGDTLKNAARILNTFNSRSASTGVLLTGEKGSGKTLLAKMLSVKGYDQEIPTIVINAPWHGDKFNAFMQMIEQPVIILFDEFEKVYDSDDQESMLTLLDGVFPSKKLFVLTCNDKWRIDSHMRNRPGRVFYNLEYKGLDADFIREYCGDNLEDQEYVERIVQIAGTFDQFNFDMLKALVEEMNRYKESPQEALRMLNAKPEYGASSRYKLDLQIEGVEVGYNKYETREWEGNPLSKQITIEYKTVEKDEDGDEIEDWHVARFEPTDLKKIEADGTKYTFFNKEGARVTLDKVKEKNYSYFDAF
jgi:hypothetical protein